MLLKWFVEHLGSIRTEVGVTGASQRPVQGRPSGAGSIHEKRAGRTGAGVSLYLKRVDAIYLQVITNCPILHKFSHGMKKFLKM